MIFHIAFICNGFSSFVFCFSFSFIWIWMPARVCVCCATSSTLMIIILFVRYIPFEKNVFLSSLSSFFFLVRFERCVSFFIYVYFRLIFSSTFCVNHHFGYLPRNLTFQYDTLDFLQFIRGCGCFFLSHIYCFSSVYLFILLNFQFEMKTGLICIGMNRVNAFDIANWKGQF